MSQPTFSEGHVRLAVLHPIDHWVFGTEGVSEAVALLPHNSPGEVLFIWCEGRVVLPLLKIGMPRICHGSSVCHGELDRVHLAPLVAS